MYEILMVVYLVLALALIGFILVQKGKGAGMGASFGGGASGTVFGASGSGNFLTKTTTILAIGFFGVALALGYMTSETTGPGATNNTLFSEEDMQQATPELPAANSEIPQAEANKDLPQANEIQKVVTEEAEKAEKEEPKPKKDDGSQ